MSYLSDSSSGSSKTRKGGGNCVGIPKKCCSCDAGIVTFMSHSKANPNRMFFRCATAASLKLSYDNHTFKWVDKAASLKFCDDNHTFKWVDEEVDEEVPKMSTLVKKLERDVCEVKTDFLELLKQLDEHKKRVKLGCVAAVICCMFVVVLLKFI